MSHRSGDRYRFDGLGPTPPPGDLRARTLGAARRAALDPPAPAWRAMLSFFGAQPAWTAALVALVAAHLLLGFLHAGATPRQATSPRRAEEAAQPDLLRLPNIRDLARQVSDPVLESARRKGDFL